MLMIPRFRSSISAGGALALTLLPLLMASGRAEQNPAAAAVAPRSALVLNARLQRPENSLDESRPGVEAYSSSAGSAELASARNFIATGGDSGQPPPRRRYGRPNYHDRMHNSDGSSKLALVLGGGMTPPAGGTKKYLTLSYKAQAGVGYNFNRTFGVVLQFDYDHFGLTGTELASQRQKYMALQIPDGQGGTIDVSGLNANSHIYGFTVNPVVNFYTSDTLGAYVVAGVGLYHKAVNFTLPQSGTYCDIYYCSQFVSDQNFDVYTTNSLGASGGLGLTYKGSKFSGQRFFAEVRYVYLANKPLAANTNSLYPAAYLRNGYFPVTVGLRF